MKLKLDFGKLFIAILFICLVLLAAISCKENSTENKDFFIPLFKVKAGQTFTFAKTDGVEYWIKYRGKNNNQFVFEWPTGLMANGGDIRETYIHVNSKMYYINFITLNKDLVTIYVEPSND